LWNVAVTLKLAADECHITAHACDSLDVCRFDLRGNFSTLLDWLDVSPSPDVLQYAAVTVYR